MKVILSGATGYIGSEVLTVCLNHPLVTSLVILTRRNPGERARHPKAKSIIVEDFKSYDDTLLSEISTADAAIWCLGTYTGNETVDIEFPRTFINAVKSFQPRPERFRYVQLGGAFTEPPSKEGQKDRSLWYFANGRRIRGKVESVVLEAATVEKSLDVYLVKPAMVLPQKAAVFRSWIPGNASLATSIDLLGALMVDLAVHGNDQKVFLNRDVVEHGKKLLKHSV